MTVTLQAKFKEGLILKKKSQIEFLEFKMTEVGL